MRISDWSSDVCSSDLLVAIGALGVAVNDDLALEDRARLVVDDALEDLAAGGVRHQVVDPRGVVAVLLAAHQLGAVQVAVGAGAVQAPGAAGRASCRERGG